MSSTTLQLRENSDYESLWAICKYFGGLMDGYSNALMMLNIRPESKLKIPKITIKRAYSVLFLIESNKEAVRALACVYLFLVDFVDDKVYNYFLSHLKTQKEAGGTAPEKLLYIVEAFKDETFASRFKTFNELKEERRINLIKELNYLLQLAEWEDLMISEDLIKNKEQGQ